MHDGVVFGTRCNDRTLAVSIAVTSTEDAQEISEDGTAAPEPARFRRPGEDVSIVLVA